MTATQIDHETVPETRITSKQKKFLKGLGHSISPVVTVGKEGFSEKTVKATILELSRHELIKIKLGKSCPTSKQDTADLLIARSSCSLVQVIGNTILLFKKNPDLEKDKQIQLP